MAQGLGSCCASHGVDAVEVLIDDSSEKWSEYKLKDGTTIRMKQTVLEISRALNEYDPEGNPMYQIKAQPVITVIDIPEGLKRKVN